MIREQLQKEARVWQKSSHFWRFTSRSLFPGGQPLPGKEVFSNLIDLYSKFSLDWEDQSFEEVKWAHRWYTSQNQEHVYVSGNELASKLYLNYF
jgi:hypothetical protein